MSDVIADSCVAAKWVIPEPDSAQAKRVLREVSLRGDQVIVLDLVLPEVANAIWKRHHRRQLLILES